MHSDPDYSTMHNELTTQFYQAPLDDFALEAAIYWFAADYHAGQFSDLYSALSMSTYSPGLTEAGPSCQLSTLMYNHLTTKYIGE